jgi:hypothetical protein
VRGPDAGILSDNPAELPLIESKTVFKQSRPPLSSQNSNTLCERPPNEQRKIPGGASAIS